jgi:hypothetical protein
LLTLCYGQELKVPKCSSLAYRNFIPGEASEFKRVQSALYSSFDPLIKVGSESVKFIGDDTPPLFKYLGRKIQYDSRTDLVIADITMGLKKWLKIVDDTPLTGPMKCWIVNHHVCSKLAWVLMIYDFSQSQALKWHKLIHPYYRRWIGLAKSAESSVLYRSCEHFGLNFKNLTVVLQQLQVTKWYILKHSRDANMQKLYAYRLQREREGHTGKGRRFSPCLKLEDLESQLSLQKIIGHAQSTRHGIGYLRKREYSDGDKERRRQLALILKREAEEKRLCILENYKMQANWLKWGLENMMDKDLTWKKIIYGYDHRW